ncbi:unnamed protein product [Caenorhabditis nigoni]
MSDNKKKEFRISHVFNIPSNVKYEEYSDGDVVKRFGVHWKIQLCTYSSGNIYPRLLCKSSLTGNWSIKTVNDVIVGCIYKSDFPKFRIDESAEIEFHVKINIMTGIPEKQILMNFDDDVAKDASDVVLMIGDQKFYVAKLLLTFHSTYFKSLFSGNFSESQKSEIELKDIDPENFQDFLEIIYGVSLVDDDTVSEILSLSDYFDAKTAIKRCEDFLMNYSRKSPEEKFGMAVDYKMENLKNKCLPGIQNSNDI